MNTCGTCANAFPLPGQAIQKRGCRGAPPQIVVTGQGMQMMYPCVGINDPSCGMWKSKLIIDQSALPKHTKTDGNPAVKAKGE